MSAFVEVNHRDKTLIVIDSSNLSSPPVLKRLCHDVVSASMNALQSEIALAFRNRCEFISESGQCRVRAFPWCRVFDGELAGAASHASTYFVFDANSSRLLLWETETNSVLASIAHLPSGIGSLRTSLRMFPSFQLNRSFLFLPHDILDVSWTATELKQTRHSQLEVVYKYGRGGVIFKQKGDEHAHAYVRLHQDDPVPIPIDTKDVVNVFFTNSSIAVLGKKLVSWFEFM